MPDVKKTEEKIFKFFDIYENFNELSESEWSRISGKEIEWENSLSEDFIEKYADKLKWDIISEKQNLSVSFISRHIDKISLGSLLKNEFISKNTKLAFYNDIEKHLLKLDWINYSLEKNSENITGNEAVRITANLHSYGKHIPEKFLKKYFNRYKDNLTFLGGIIKHKKIKDKELLDKIKNHIFSLNKKELILNFITYQDIDEQTAEKYIKDMTIKQYEDFIKDKAGKFSEDFFIKNLYFGPNILLKSYFDFSEKFLKRIYKEFKDTDENIGKNICMYQNSPDEKFLFEIIKDDAGKNYGIISGPKLAKLSYGFIKNNPQYIDWSVFFKYADLNEEQVLEMGYYVKVVDISLHKKDLSKDFIMKHLESFLKIEEGAEALLTSRTFTEKEWDRITDILLDKTPAFIIENICRQVKIPDSALIKLGKWGLAGYIKNRYYTKKEKIDFLLKNKEYINKYCYSYISGKDFKDFLFGPLLKTENKIGYLETVYPLIKIFEDNKFKYRKSEIMRILKSPDEWKIFIKRKAEEINNKYPEKNQELKQNLLMGNILNVIENIITNLNIQEKKEKIMEKIFPSGLKNRTKDKN